MKLINLALVIILIAGAVALSGCVAPSVNDTNNTTQQNTTQTAASTNNTYQNKFVSFTKPDGLTITDNSNDTSLDVLFKQGDTFVAEINFSSTGQDYVNDIIAQSTKTTIANKTAYEFSDSTNKQAYIDGGILIRFNSNYMAQYNTVKDSLVIFKNPTE